MVTKVISGLQSTAYTCPGNSKWKITIDEGVKSGKESNHFIRKTQDEHTQGNKWKIHINQGSR